MFINFGSSNFEGIPEKKNKIKTDAYLVPLMYIIYYTIPNKKQ